MTDSQEITTADVAPAPVELGPIMRRIIAGLPPEYLQLRDADAASMDIVGAILDADSPDDVFATKGLIHAEEVRGIPLYITGFKVNNGDFGPYFVIDAVNVSGQTVRVFDEENTPHDFAHGYVLEPGVSCGSQFVMAQLAKCAREGWLPYTAKIVERNTGGGNTVLRLAKADRDAFEVPVTVEGE